MIVPQYKAMYYFFLSVCTSKDIRNKVEKFKNLTNCTVIEGSLQILLIDYADPSQYDDLSFPNLTEITDYLLLYRVYGLRSLSHIFPNLAVIRGRKLFYNYALVAYEMPDFEDLGLGSLTKIMRGAIRLEKNPKLCYIDTINWTHITDPSITMEDNFIMANKDPDECVNVCPTDANEDPICPVDTVMYEGSKRKQARCWNAKKCQKSEYFSYSIFYSIWMTNEIKLRNSSLGVASHKRTSLRRYHRCKIFVWKDSV